MFIIQYLINGFALLICTWPRLWRNNLLLIPFSLFNVIADHIYNRIGLKPFQSLNKWDCLFITLLFLQQFSYLVCLEWICFFLFDFFLLFFWFTQILTNDLNSISLASAKVIPLHSDNFDDFIASQKYTLVKCMFIFKLASWFFYFFACFLYFSPPSPFHSVPIIFIIRLKLVFAPWYVE